MVEIIPAERMRIIFIFLNFLIFTLLWNLYYVCGEPSGLMELYDCINDVTVCVREYRNKSVLDSMATEAIVPSLLVQNEGNCVVRCLRSEDCSAAEIRTATGTTKLQCFMLNTVGLMTTSTGSLFVKVPACSWARVFAPFTLHWISVGQAGIWGVHKPNGSDYGQIYYVEDSRNGNRPGTLSWQQVSGELEQLSVGIDVVAGVKINHLIFTRLDVSDGSVLGSRWHQMPGSLVQLSVREETGQIWGVNRHDDIYFWNNVNTHLGGSWVRLTGKLQYVSAGETGVWGIDLDNLMVYRDYDQSTFIAVADEGEFQQVSAEGSPWVVAVDLSGRLSYRTGISSDNPTGDGWKEIEFSEGDVKQASMYKNELWIVLNNGELWRTTHYV